MSDLPAQKWNLGCQGCFCSTFKASAWPHCHPGRLPHQRGMRLPERLSCSRGDGGVPCRHPHASCVQAVPPIPCLQPCADPRGACVCQSCTQSMRLTEAFSAQQSRRQHCHTSGASESEQRLKTPENLFVVKRRLITQHRTFFIIADCRALEWKDGGNEGSM